MHTDDASRYSYTPYTEIIPRDRMERRVAQLRIARGMGVDLDDE